MPFFVATNFTIACIQRRSASTGRDVLFTQLFGQIAKVLDFAAIDRLEQGFTRWEMPIQGADAYAGGSGNGFQARLGATGTENHLGRLDYTLVIANGVGTGLSQGRLHLRHDNLFSSPAVLKNGGSLRIFFSGNACHTIAAQGKW